MDFSDSIISTTRESLDNTMIAVPRKKKIQIKRLIEDTVLEEPSKESNSEDVVMDQTKIDLISLKEYVDITMEMPSEEAKKKNQNILNCDDSDYDPTNDPILREYLDI